MGEAFGIDLIVSLGPWARAALDKEEGPGIWEERENRISRGTTKT